MGNKTFTLTLLIAIVIGTSIFSWAPNKSIAGDQFADETTIAGYKLAIVEHDDKCELFYQGEKGSGKLPLGPKPPCRFLTRPGGKVDFYSYPDVNVKAVLVIVGTPKKPDQKIPIAIKNNGYCGDENQGILIREDGVYVTKLVMHGGLICTNVGIDETDYWIFAHEKELIGPK